MLTLLPLLLGPQNADPLTVLRTTLASPKTITAKVVSDGVSGTLTVAADGSVLVVSGGERLIHNAQGDWEFDDAGRIFDRLPPTGPLLGGRVGTERLTSRASHLIVPFLARRGKDGALDRVFSREGSMYTTRGNGFTFTLGFGKDRMLSLVRIISETGGQEWTLSGFRAIASNPALFKTNVPSGYSEAFEDRQPDSLAIGTALPAKYAALAPKGTKSWILAVLESGVEPNERARAWLGRLAPKIPSGILDRATVVDRKALRAPDSPTYLLIGDGKVLGVWIGYDPREEARIEREMQSVIEEAGSSS